MWFWNCSSSPNNTQYNMIGTTQARCRNFYWKEQSYKGVQLLWSLTRFELWTRYDLSANTLKQCEADNRYLHTSAPASGLIYFWNHYCGVSDIPMAIIKSKPLRNCVGAIIKKQCSQFFTSMYKTNKDKQAFKHFLSIWTWTLIPKTHWLAAWLAKISKVSQCETMLHVCTSI